MEGFTYILNSQYTLVEFNYGLNVSMHMKYAFAHQKFSGFV